MPKVLKIALIISIIILFFGNCKAENVPVFMYHHLRSPNQGMTGAAKDLSCDRKTFIDHLNQIQRFGYTTVTFKDILAENVAEKMVILTFDDGTISQFWAFEELKKRQMVGVFFIVVNYVSYNLHYLNNEHIKTMIRSGMEIGSHSYSHNFLSKEGKGIDFEINGSKKKLEAMFGTKIITFCYPYGDYNKKVLNVLEKSEYHYARTTNEKVGRLTRERNFEVPIVYIHNSTRDISRWLK